MAPAATEADAGRTAQQIRLELLDLDPLNPRLVVEDGISQEGLAAKLYEEEGLDELVPSFLENGYFDEEPLVVVPKGRRFTVVEGNRRLATLKVLHGDELRRRLRVTGWPKMTPSQRTRLTRIPCVVYPSREDVLPFLGFRHITGAKKWAPFQKARFVNQLVESGQSLSHIQETIGDTTRATRKLYQEYVVFTQLVDELDYPSSVLRDRFSLLEVMLGQRPIKRYLGISSSLPTGRITQVVPGSHLDTLSEVTTWVFGDGRKRPVIDESRDISRRLAPVIANDEAREYLQRTNNLEGAYERTDGEQRFLLRKLAQIERTIQDVAGLLPLHVAEDAVRASVERIVVLADSLGKQMR